MKQLTSADEIEALPRDSVVVLAAEKHGFPELAIYQKFDSRWTEMDPTDRDDGERSWTGEDLWIIATQRDHLVPYLAFDPREVGLGE